MSHERDQSRATEHAPPEPQGELAPGRTSRTDGLLGLNGPRESGFVQRKAEGSTTLDEDSVRTVAANGIAGGGDPLPHLDQIQRSFGEHDVSGVRAHIGGVAAESAGAMGAEAYASGGHVAFASSPSVFLAAHEAAHVVQQRAGVSLKGGVGQAGDDYENHADAVADLVVRGESAETLLGTMRGESSSTSVQRKESKAKGKDKGDKDKDKDKDEVKGLKGVEAARCINVAHDMLVDEGFLLMGWAAENAASFDEAHARVTAALARQKEEEELASGMFFGALKMMFGGDLAEAAASKFRKPVAKMIEKLVEAGVDAVVDKLETGAVMDGRLDAKSPVTFWTSLQSTIGRVIGSYGAGMTRWAANLESGKIPSLERDPLEVAHEALDLLKRELGYPHIPKAKEWERTLWIKWLETNDLNSALWGPKMEIISELDRLGMLGDTWFGTSLDEDEIKERYEMKHRMKKIRGIAREAKANKKKADD